MLDGDFRFTTGTKESGTCQLTITKRNGRKVEASTTNTFRGQQKERIEYEGVIDGNSITLNRVRSARKATLSGRLVGGSLQLNWTSDYTGPATVVFKLPK